MLNMVMVITLGDDDDDHDGNVEYGDGYHLGYVEDNREEEGRHDVDGQVDRGGVAPLKISLQQFLSDPGPIIVYPCH